MNRDFWVKLGTLYVATLSAQLFSLAYGRADLTQPFLSMVLPSVLALSVVSIPAIVVGLKLASSTGLGTPQLDQWLAIASATSRQYRVGNIIALLGGALLGAVMLTWRYLVVDYLPADLPEFGHRGALGGFAVSVGAAVAEEVWFRLGIMTLLVWIALRILPDRIKREHVIVGVIFIASLPFAFAHIPQLMSYGIDSTSAVLRTIAGNVIVSCFYGWCFWRYGLIAAILAHFSADIVMHVLPAFY